jgi:hypothetical protein
MLFAFRGAMIAGASGCAVAALMACPKAVRVQARKWLYSASIAIKP